MSKNVTKGKLHYCGGHAASGEAIRCVYVEMFQQKNINRYASQALLGFTNSIV
jgi:hypothetical protein